MEQRALTRAQAILHPVRARILVAVSDRVMTPRQIAARMSEIPLGTVYRHIGVLRNAGILRVVGERRGRGPTERQYALVEEASYVNREEVGAEEVMGLVAALTGVLESAFGRFLRQATFPLPEGRISLLVKSVSLTPEETKALRATVFEYAGRSGRVPGEGAERRLIGFFTVPDADPPDDDEGSPGDAVSNQPAVAG
ncbi:MAG: helix-turn-helix domain-containing protein [Capsulimonadales bacterium]|nr:helix-turn-helix domain-containing protein [Capsulimonadales bacterium]